MDDFIPNNALKLAPFLPDPIYLAVRAALQLAERHSWHLPICEQVVRVLDGLTTPAEAVRALMERGLRPEMVEP